MKRIVWLVSILALAVLVVGTNVNAETGVRYNTFTLSDGRLVRTQTAYVPVTSMNTIGGFQLESPRDIHIDQNDII